MSSVPARLLLAVCWPPALTAALYLTVGRLGFSPTDEGLMQAYSMRILAGQVPHKDFISPRPLGSALFHTVEFAFPAPLFEVARVIALCEYTACVIFVAWLVYEAPPWRWGVLAAAGAAGSVLVNLNIFLLTTWYTVDGLMLVAAGLLLVDRRARTGRSILKLAGFLLLGASLLTKQSFFLAPLLGWLMISLNLHRYRNWGRRLCELLVTGIVASAPGVVYVASIALLGGLPEARRQLFSGSFVYGSELLAPLRSPYDLSRLALILSFEVALLVTIRVARDRQAAAPRLGSPRFIELAARLGLSGMLIGLPLYSDFGIKGPLWGVRIVWMLIVFIAARVVLFPSFDPVALSILAMAWMAMLSWGYPWPNLICGSAVLYMLHRTWQGLELSERESRTLRGPLLTSGVAAFVVTASLFVDARSRVIYEDLSAQSLTASLGVVSPAFGSIHTNPRTRDYISQIDMCVHRYPARWVAVLPENAAAYPAFSLRNPFPIDWMWPDDFKGSYSRFLSTADRLNREGDYLVLFQTLDPATFHPVRAASAESPIISYADDHRTPTDIYNRLAGARTPCGSFIAVHAGPR